jgi:DNA-binding NarL/FixJ family response regulator
MAESLKATIINASTDQVSERELTAQEVSQHNTYLAENKRLNDEAESKIAARESALAKLASLGLTEAEIAAL